MRPSETSKATLALCRTLILIAGFATLLPAFAVARMTGVQQQVDVPNPDVEEPAQQTAPESAGDTASSAVPPTSARTSSGSALNVGAEPSDSFSLGLYGTLAVVVTIFTGLLVWRLRNASVGSSNRRRRATGATSISRRKPPF